MGVLNVTPDSFFRRQQVLQRRNMRRARLQMERGGADLIDIRRRIHAAGFRRNFSRRRMEKTLSRAQRLRRLLKIPISIDTQKAEVAETALDSGAEIINDISGLKSEHALPKSPHVIASRSS